MYSISVRDLEAIANSPNPKVKLPKTVIGFWQMQLLTDGFYFGIYDTDEEFKQASKLPFKKIPRKGKTGFYYIGAKDGDLRDMIKA